MASGLRANPDCASMVTWKAQTYVEFTRTVYSEFPQAANAELVDLLWSRLLASKQGRAADVRKVLPTGTSEPRVMVPDNWAALHQQMLSRRSMGSRNNEATLRQQEGED